MPIADTLLRLAEEPAFYVPKWSLDILEEVRRTLCSKLTYSPEQANRRIDCMQKAFPDAAVDGYQDLTVAMKNHSQDRHVLAAAVRCGANAIVTDNLKHFPPTALELYGIEALSANHFIEHQYHLDPDALINLLTNQALNINWTLRELLARHVPCLSKLIST